MINCAAYTDVDSAEIDQDKSRNDKLACELAKVCEEEGDAYSHKY